MASHSPSTAHLHVSAPLNTKPEELQLSPKGHVVTLPSQGDSKVPPGEAGAKPSSLEGRARGRARGYTRLLPGFLQSRRSPPSSTPQPAQSLDKVEMRISTMRPTGMRNEGKGSTEQALKPHSPSPFPLSVVLAPFSQREEPPTQPFPRGSSWGRQQALARVGKWIS